MRRHLGKKLAAVAVAAIVVTALAAGSAFAAPVLQPGQTSAPGMGGNCASCHRYAAPAAPKPAAKPTLFSRPMLKAAKFKRGRFAALGYCAPTLCSATDATVTIGVERLGKRGHWVAIPSMAQTATVSATGKYAGKVNYKAMMKITRLGRYRLRAKLVYLNADGLSLRKWSKPTTVVIKK